MVDRYRNPSQQDRSRPHFDYDDEREQARMQSRNRDHWRESREQHGPYAGYYNERQYGERGLDEREQGPRYASEEAWRPWPREAHRDGQERYGYAPEHETRARLGQYERTYGQRQGGYPERYEDGTQYVVGSAHRSEQAYRPGNDQSYPPRRDWGSGPTESDYSRQFRSREHESFGQQLREAGQRIATRVKRAFRGPKGYKRSDERIREDVSDRLGEHAHLDCTEVEVTVSHGEVTLVGVVRSRQEKFLAEEIADDVSGVNDVHNQLRVKRDHGATNADNAAQNSTQGEAARGRNARA